MTFDRIVAGGRVVTPGGVLTADVGIRAGTIIAVEPGLAERAETTEHVDARGLFVLPGAVDVHTHTRVASDAEPDRFFQDSVAAAFGGTTTFLAFNNPGTGSTPAAERSLLAGLAEWRAATEHDSAIDHGISLAISGRMEELADELETIVDEGAPTAKAFMVFDFRLDDRRLFDALDRLGRRGGLLQVHCEDPVLLDALVAGALKAGTTHPRYHATTRPGYVEGVATRRALAFARATGAPVHVVHLSSREALDAVAEAKAAGVRVTAETCPHYLVLTDERYAEPDPVRCAACVISPPLRDAATRDALWAALADGTLDLVATDHVPDRLAVEKAEAARGVPFNRISNGAPGIETLLTLLYAEGVASGRLTLERLAEVVSDTPARRFGLRAKGRISPGMDADLVLLDPDARRTIRAGELHHTSDYTPYEGMEVAGAVRDVWLRGRDVVRGGRFVGTRGTGRLVDRTAIE